MEGKYVHDGQGNLKMRGGRPSKVIKSKREYNRKDKQWKETEDNNPKPT